MIDTSRGSSSLEYGRGWVARLRLAVGSRWQGMGIQATRDLENDRTRYIHVKRIRITPGSLLFVPASLVVDLLPTLAPRLYIIRSRREFDIARVQRALIRLSCFAATLLAITARQPLARIRAQ